MNTKIKARIEQLTADIEIIDGAIQLSHRLTNHYLNECNIKMARVSNDTIIALNNERELLINEQMSLMNSL